MSGDAANELCKGFVWLDSAALARREGDAEDAERRIEKAEAVFREIGDRAYEGLCLCERGQIALARGDGAGAAGSLDRARAIAGELGLGRESRLGRAIAHLDDACVRAGSAPRP